MPSLRIAFVALPLVAIVTGCAAKRSAPEVATAPAVQPAAPMPLPPAGAAANITLPQRLSDGSYATPNRALSDAGAVWHLRSALNVAALQCNDPVGLAAYNRLLTMQKRGLADAHRELAAEYRVVHGAKGWQSAFDGAMTRVYNFFALPPVRGGFCDAAGDALRQAAALPAGQLATFAPTALAQIEAPFVDFYQRYERYQIALADWRSGRQLASTASAAPRLAYHAAVFAGPDIVTGGTGHTRLAAR